MPDTATPRITHLIRAFDIGDNSGRSDNFACYSAEHAREQFDSLQATGLCRRIELLAFIDTYIAAPR